MTPKEKAKLLEEINGYSHKEVLALFVLPEIRSVQKAFDEFICNEYVPFRKSMNHWRFVLTGIVIGVTGLVTVLGTVAAIYGNLRF